MFKNDLNLLETSKNIRYFCRQFFVRMRDTSIGYDVNITQSYWLSKINKLFQKTVTWRECIYFIAWNKYR